MAKSLRLEPYLDRRFFSYSTGIKRRFDIARSCPTSPISCCWMNPPPTWTPSPPWKCGDLLVQLKNRGKTLITVTHNLDEVRKLGRRLAIMREGIFREVSLAPEENLEELYRRVVLGGGGAE